MKKIILTTTILFLTLATAFSQSDDNRTIRVPVVFHVLYADSAADNGVNKEAIENGNSSQYIPSNKLLAELKDLHDDFLLLNADIAAIAPMFKNIAGNCRVEFFLADSVFQPGGEKGIIRMKTNNNKCELYNQSPPVDPLGYLNIYIGRIRTKCGVFGKATNGITNVPFDSLYHKNDGINLNYQWVGLGYRLLTHEAGHWTGLWHTFEGACNGTGDDISDTPPQKRPTDVDCVKCPPAGDTNLSCDPTLPFNYNNFMDYSGCRKMFTAEQVAQIRKTLQLYRPKIWRCSM